MNDLSGRSFGKWSVVKRVKNSTASKGARYLCRCECGTEKEVFGKHLRNGKSKSCGCSHKKDWVGFRNGSLEVVSVDNRDDSTRLICRCDCGNVVDISTTSIYKQVSCGCSRFIDCVGEKYGMLTIKSLLHNYNNTRITYVVCDCECGNRDVITRLNGLRSGNTKSCGCIHSPSLLNKKFGMLTVVSEEQSNSSQRRWLCKCDCGATITLTSYQITSGHTKSCGCLRSDAVSYFEHLVRGYLSNIDINFNAEYSFANCTGVTGYPLRFDFYLPDINLVIECDGIQHFRPVKYFGGLQRFDRQRANDQIKNTYCEENNIHLLRIPYTINDNMTKLYISHFINYLTHKNPVTITV